MAVKLKTRAQFPASVAASSPLSLTKAGLSYTFSLNVNALRTTFDSIYAQVPLAPGTVAFSSLGGNISVSQMNNGTGASATTFWCGDGTWKAVSALGDVTGPASSTDKAIPRFNGTGGKTLQNSLVTIDDLGAIRINSDSTFIGKNAGLNNHTPAPTDGINNTFIGSNAGAANTSGYAALFIGYNAGAANTTGIVNTFLGYQAGLRNTVGSCNTFIGADAGAGNVGGDNQVIIGFHAGLNLNPGAGQGRNVIIGYEASIVASTGVDNSFVGYRTGYNNTSGAQNSFFGSLAGFANTTATFNTLVGYNAGTGLTTGGDNTIVGGRAGESATVGTGNVFIGRAAGFYETGSSKLFIDNTSRANEADARVKALVYGIFNAATANQEFHVNGSVTGLISGTFGSGTIETGVALAAVHDGSTTAGMRIKDSNAAAATDNAVIFTRNGSGVGSITTSLTTTTYNTSSDRDRKTDIQPFERSSEIIDALKVRDFEWKLEPGKRGVGLIAQEAYEVFPDPVCPSEEVGGWTVDYSKYVPVLIAEIQRLRQRIQRLEEDQCATLA